MVGHGRWGAGAHWACAIAALLCTATASAQPAPVDASEIPAELRPWVGWVLANDNTRACAFRDGQPACVWPSKLDLALDAKGGQFSQSFIADREQVVSLPGSLERWPEEVRIDGRPVPVLDDDGGPSVRLAAGRHEIAGRFAWPSLPERLEIPTDTALVALRVQGEIVMFPRRTAEGHLWLAGGPAEGGEAERIDLSVHRRIEDGVPLYVTTRIQLRVSGRARELSLGHVLLPGTAPVSIASDLPARLDESGELRLQARAGSHRIEVRARTIGSPNTLAFQPPGPDWPRQEVWVWKADEALRQVDLRGIPAVDPARTDVGDDWRGLPTFLLESGSKLELVTARRGEPEPPPNKLSLERDLWLDLDGRGYSVRDRIGTNLFGGWRLDLLEGELGRVSGDSGDLLVTRAPAGGHAGVELRNKGEALTAEWRAPEALSRLPAVAWSDDVQSLSATLHLGPGWNVLAASGPDKMEGTWIERWDLFGFFYVLLITLGVGRVLGWRWAVLALAALVACAHENDAPYGIWLALVLFAALLRALPAGRWRTAAHAAYGATLALFALIALPFAVAQLRTAIYPQLGSRAPSAFHQNLMFGVAAAPKASFASPMRESAQGEAEHLSAPRAAGIIGIAGEDAEPSSALGALYERKEKAAATPEWLDASRVQEQAPEAVVQTGPGMPGWAWQSWTMKWSGPVERSHEIRLWLIPPWANRGLAVVRVLLVLALALVLGRRAWSAIPRAGASPPPSAPTDLAAASTLALFLGVLCSAGSARAEIPDKAVLDDLHARLTEPPDCRPDCVSIDSLDIEVTGSTLQLRASVHAGERTAVRLPGPASVWVPTEVRLDGKTQAPMRLGKDGFLQVRVEAGLSIVEITGPIPARDTLTLAFGDKPHRARVRADGWRVDGVREDARVEDAVQLSRLVAADGQGALEDEALPPWLVLERTINIGPVWEMHTTLTRVSPAGTPLIAQVPLLEGESVTESAFTVKDGVLEVPLSRDATKASWTSSLTPRPRLDLTAIQERPWTERWTLRCGPVWHCTPEGIAPLQQGASDYWEPVFVPWPGERVSILAVKPEAAPGQSITIDSADLDVNPGVRMLSATLKLRVRSSKGGVQKVTLPADARVRSLKVNNEARAIRREGNALSFTLGTGSEAIEIEWQEPRGMAPLLSAPHVDLHRAAANATTVVHAPPERWLLWASGPAWGPAILFWGFLAAVLLAAVLLGRIPASALRGYEWALLGLGLTQIDALAALCVVGWFFAIRWRERRTDLTGWSLGLVQIALVLLTIAMFESLYSAVRSGLLMQPDMQIAGADSNAEALRWYTDRISGPLPDVSVVSVPIWMWRAVMLTWSLWLAANLVRWLPWGWRAFRAGGAWKRRPKTPPPAVTPPGPASPLPDAAAPAP